MGVYLGLVEDDDARGGYDRYAARQSDYDHDDRGYDRGYRGADRYAADDRAKNRAATDDFTYTNGHAGNKRHDTPARTA